MLKRIAWFSPVALDLPLRSAFTTALLVPELRRNVEIELFVDDKDLDNLNLVPAALTEVPVYHYHRFFEREASKPFDLCVYQLEDGLRSTFCYRCQRIVPGVVLRHDINLNRMFLGAFRHSTGGTDIDRQTRELFGAKAPILGEYAVRGWSLELFDRMLMRGIAGPAKFQASIFNDGESACVAGEGEVLDPPSPLELFPKLNICREREDGAEFVVGLTAGRELEHRIEWTTQTVSQLAGDGLSFKWCLGPEAIDSASAKILARFFGLSATDLMERPKLALGSGQVELIKCRTTAEYLEQISKFDLYVAPQLSAGRGFGVELDYARACGIPIFVSGYLASHRQADPGMAVFEPGARGTLALIAGVKAISRSKFKPILPPVPTVPYDCRFLDFINRLFSSGIVQRDRRRARAARSELAQQLLAESPSERLKADYRRLVTAAIPVQ